MYGTPSAGGRIINSAPQQERANNRKMRQLNGKFASQGATPSDLVEFEGDNAVPRKRRKFGRDSRNVVVGVVDNSDSVVKELEDLPVTFSTPPTSKRGQKVHFLNLRAFSNENSRFIKHFKQEAVDSQQQDEHEHQPRTSIIKTEHCGVDPCSSAQTSSADYADNQLLPFNKLQAAEQSEPWVKRKFYIVENAGRPTEIYCTDFFHKVKQGVHNKYWQDSRKDNRSLLKIKDKWREEWSINGVQMPMGNGMEKYQFEHNELFPDKPEPKLFQLPKKLVSFYPTSYTRAEPKEFQQLKRQSLCYYQIDSADEEWLDSEGYNISQKAFVDVINLLEVTSYRKIHDALLEHLPLRSSRDASEDDVDCMICDLPEWEIGDNIVFCDGCNISVHQSCYGITALPRGEWFCQLCTQFGPSTQHSQSCLFCPVKGGPMKPTKHMSAWAHVACALWLPEVRFGDVETREPITHVNEVAADKREARCAVCDTLMGACIECIHPKCSTTFHVGCAQRANFVLNIENDERHQSGVRMVSLCDKHSIPHRDKKKIRLDKNQLPEMLRNFSAFVDLREVSKQSGIALNVVERIHPYWILKRSQNNFKPLIPEPEVNDITTTTTPKYTAQGPREVAKNKSKQRSLVAVSKLYKSVPKDVLQQNYEGIRTLRTDYERARNLCYMARQREKLKLAQLDLLKEQIQKTAEVLLNDQPVIPVSKRRQDKLLQEWKDNTA